MSTGEHHQPQQQRGGASQVHAVTPSGAPIPATTTRMGAARPYLLWPAGSLPAGFFAGTPLASPFGTLPPPLTCSILPAVRHALCGAAVGRAGQGAGVVAHSLKQA